MAKTVQFLTYATNPQSASPYFCITIPTGIQTIADVAMIQKDSSAFGHWGLLKSLDCRKGWKLSAGIGNGDLRLFGYSLVRFTEKDLSDVGA